MAKKASDERESILATPEILATKRSSTSSRLHPSASKMFKP